MSSDIIEFGPHITLTNSDFRFIVCEQLQGIGIDPGHILIEPEAKKEPRGAGSWQKPKHSHPTELPLQ